MKIAMIGSKALLFLGVLLLWANCGFGQVVTSSMDPTQSILMPSAAGWREKPAAGIGYHEGSGTRDLNNQEIYQFDISGLDGNLAFTVGNAFIEMYGSQSTTNVQLDQFYEGQFNLKFNDARLNIALAGNDFLTIGLGVRSTESTDHIDANYDSETTDAMRAIGSISIKALDMFYFGLGFERVKEENTYAVGLTWNNVISGVAMHLGQPGGTQFKVEYSLAYSESQVNTLSGDLVENNHPQTAISRMSGELMFSGLLFAFKSEEKKIDVDIVENGQTVKEIKMVNNQGGVLWIPENGLSMGFYFLTGTNTASYDDSISSFKVKLAYVF
ncbi:MAG: hypothetical protein HN580_10410 [Deltaproteobacteria bacterium]|nr:hypothetical protein [Deltaproteobacteria bacterium]MBT4088704.1 hypothetical protein [Deltaproteobacteria bacterium]MBT4266966.1 hypothetical protein [Deltaproteobacteria bacterium]MBT4639687.1 hypothetical protein [Deltaproteobacteria bacterium]MBT6504892.1 hypothetical protein [Deltaproteobacteria bacterium]